MFLGFQHGEIVMTDQEFMDRAESLLHAIEQCCDRINDQGEVDIDNQRVGAMVTLVWPNRSQIIVNLQKPLHEVWMTAATIFAGARASGRTPKGRASFLTCSAVTPLRRPGRRYVLRPD